MDFVLGGSRAGQEQQQGDAAKVKAGTGEPAGAGLGLEQGCGQEVGVGSTLTWGVLPQEGPGTPGAKFPEHSPSPGTKDQLCCCPGRGGVRGARGAAARGQ